MKRAWVLLVLAVMLSGCGTAGAPPQAVTTLPFLSEASASVPPETTSSVAPYDLDYALGAGHMAWELLDGQWYVDFGVQNPTATSLDLIFEASDDYRDSGIHATASTGNRFFLERLTGGQWTSLPVEGSMEPQAIAAGTRIPLSWETPLEPGFYRVGIDCTAEAGALGTDHRVCYGKFRIFDPETKEALILCRSSLDRLLAEDHYHLTSHEINRHRSRPDEDFFMHHEIWKAGGDSLSLTESRMLADNEFRFVNGQQILEGQGHRLEFQGEDFSGPVSREALDNPELSDTWTFPYRMLDSLVREVRETEAGVTVICDCSTRNGVENTEFVFSYRSDGSLRSLQRIEVGTDGRRSVEAELTVYDESAEKIASGIREAF